MYGCCRASLEKGKRRPCDRDAFCNLSLDREARGLCLEENLQRKLQRSSFAREHRAKVVEDAALRFKGVARGTGNALGSHRVGRSTERTGASTRGAAWNELRMIQQVEGLHSELNFEPFGDREALDRCGVEVVRRWRENSIAAGIRQGAIVGLDIFCSWVGCGVTHDIVCNVQDVSQSAIRRRHGASAKWHYTASGDSNTRGVGNRAIPSRVPVQVGIDPALRGCPLSGLIGVNWSDLPIAQNVPGERIATLEERLVIYQRHSKPVAMIQS